MTEQLSEHTQFYLTTPMPCPYLEGRMERKLFTHLTGRRAALTHEVLAQHGFRRSQNIVYRPACDGCTACKSARVVAAEFAPDRGQRRVQRRNSDISGLEVFPEASAEQFELFKRYLSARHANGGMNSMSFADYEYMVEDTAVQSLLIEYRLAEGKEAGRLAAVALTDLLADGLSMVYSFFDPDFGRRSLGTFMILDHLRRARQSGLGYVYLGYWVKNSRKMAYKGEFRPLETLSSGQRWQRAG